MKRMDAFTTHQTAIKDVKRLAPQWWGLPNITAGNWCSYIFGPCAFQRFRSSFSSRWCDGCLHLKSTWDVCGSWSLSSCRLIWFNAHPSGSICNPHFRIYLHLPTSSRTRKSGRSSAFHGWSYLYGQVCQLDLQKQKQTNPFVICRLKFYEVYNLRFTSLLEGSIQHQTGTAYFHSLCGWCGPWACQVARHSAPNQSPQAKHWPLNNPKTSFSKGARCQVPTQKVRDLESQTPDLLQKRWKKLFILILFTWKTFGRWAQS